MICSSNDFIANIGHNESETKGLEREAKHFGLILIISWIVRNLFFFLIKWLHLMKLNGSIETMLFFDTFFIEMKH